MKVLLVNPPLKSANPSEPIPFPLGLGYLAASLRQAGYQPVFLDASLGPARKATREQLYEIGLNLAEITNEAIIYKPDIVGISVPFTSRLKVSIEIVRRLKQVDLMIIQLARRNIAVPGCRKSVEVGFADHKDRASADFISFYVGCQCLVHFLKVSEVVNNLKLFQPS